LRLLIGASVLSAAGSLPLQILPFLVLTLIAEARFEVAFAGWVGSAFLVGMLSSSLLLPSLGVSRLNRGHAICCLGAIVLSLAVTMSSSSPLLFLVLWFVVGVACGGLQFLGATTAAAVANKKQAFALRLAVALIVASSVIVALAQFGSQKSYVTLALFLIGAFGLAAFIGLPLYRKVCGNEVSSAVVIGNASEQRSWSGLIIVFAFFVGQPGFWAYAMQSAAERGLQLEGCGFGDRLI
jgi:MFS family permease